MKLKVKIDGKEQEVDLTDEQLAESYQKAQHFTKSMQEVSDKEKALADKEKAILLQAREVESLKTIIEEMKTNPELNTQLNKVYSDFKSGKITASQADQKAGKMLDKLIDNASTAEEREALMRTRRIIEEETSDRLSAMTALEKKIADLESKLLGVTETARSIQEKEANDRMKQVRTKFGDELVNKYEADLKSLTVKYPRLSLNALVATVVGDDEMEKALLNNKEKLDKEELERKKKGSFPGLGGGMPGDKKAEIPRDKNGRIDWKNWKNQLKESIYG